MTTTKVTQAAAIAALDTLKAYLAVGSSLAASVTDTIDAALASTILTGSTPLDKRLIVFPYKPGSESAKKLSTALGVLRMSHEGGTYLGKAGQFIFNWGAGTSVFQSGKVGAAKVLNPPQLVDKAVNKKTFFETMLGDGAPRVPFWTTSEQQARAWLAVGYHIVVRKVLEGKKGEGLVVVTKPLDFVTGKLYTMLVPNNHEYRVYIFDGKVLDARKKVLKSGVTADPNGIRSDEEKYLFANMDLADLPEDVIIQSKKCSAKMGLLTGGIDVIYDAVPKKAYVLEYNTAPYLGDLTAAKYAKAIKDYISTQTA